MKVTQTKKDEISLFDKLSGCRYDQFEERFYEEIFELVDLPNTTEHKVVLDAGCGSGAWGIRLARKGYTVIGVDISKTLIKSAKDWAGEDKVNFMPILCDLERLPLKTKSFELCFFGYVLHHFKSLPQISSEISRILKPRSEVIVVDPNGSNVINKLTRKVMTVFPQCWVMEKGIATSNERVHEIKFYLKTFEKGDFDSVQYWLKGRPKTTVSSRLSLLEILKLGREALYGTCQRITPSIIGKTELVIKASK